MVPGRGRSRFVKVGLDSDRTRNRGVRAIPFPGSRDSLTRPGPSHVQAPNTPGPRRRPARQGGIESAREAVLNGSRPAEESRTMLTRRTFLPILGAVPFRGGAREESPGEAAPQSV